LAAEPTIFSGARTRRSLILASALLVTLVPWVHMALADPLADADAAMKRRDFAGAHQILELEARRANAFAMNQLGLLYLRGQGVAQDCRQAYMWFSLAISYAPDQARYLEAVENQFTAEVNGGLRLRDKSEAHRLGNVWIARHGLE
jgi:TPR repeat protein